MPDDRVAYTVAVPPNDSSFELSADLPLRAAIVQVFRQELETAVALGQGTAQPPALAVRRFRRALRRARAIVRLLRPALPKPSAVALLRVLTAVARSTGALRDAEILPNALAALPKKSRRQLVQLQAILTAQRDEMHQSSEAHLRMGEGAPHLAELANGLATALPADLSHAQLALGMQQTYTRARKGRKAVKKHPSPVMIHDWRKRCKDLRHQAELLAADGLPQQQWLAALTDLTRRLGQVTDLLALKQWSRQNSPDGDAAKLLHRALKQQLAAEFEMSLALGGRIFKRKAVDQIAHLMTE